MREVSVVEDDHVALQERVAEVPAKQRAGARGVRGDYIVRNTVRYIALLVLRREVTGVDGEHLAPDLVRERVRLVAGEEGRCIAVSGVRGGDLGQDVVHDVLRATEEGVTRVDQSRNFRLVETSTSLSGIGELLTIKEHCVNGNLPTSAIPIVRKSLMIWLEKDIQGVLLIRCEGRGGDTAFLRVVEAYRHPRNVRLVNLLRELSDGDLSLARNVDRIALESNLGKTWACVISSVANPETYREQGVVDHVRLNQARHDRPIGPDLRDKRVGIRRVVELDRTQHISRLSPPVTTAHTTLFTADA